MTERETMPDRGRTPSDTPLPPPTVGGESVLNRMQENAGVTTSKDAATSQDDGRHLTGLTSADPLAIGLPPDDGPALSGGASAGRGGGRIGDRVFLAMTSGASAVVVLIVLLIAVFLVIKSVPSIADDQVNFFTSTEWSPNPGNLRFGIANLLWVTVIISLIALLVAVPIAIGIALFVTQYAPRRIARPVAFVIDLLAAIPSIVYGIWAATELSSALEPVQGFLSHIPLGLFDEKLPNGTIFDGAVVLAVMILPIITAISRDVFERTPRANIEASLALGATKWEMIRMAVLPYGRPGVVSGSMLGLGRALGETIAVYLVLSTVAPPFHVSIFTGGETFASKIANGQSEFNDPKSTGAYIAAGLVLFVLTFVVNSAARAIVNRRKDFA